LQCEILQRLDERHEGDEAECKDVVDELEPGREDELEQEVEQDERRREQRRLPGVEPNELIGRLQDEQEER